MSYITDEQSFINFNLYQQKIEADLCQDMKLYHYDREIFKKAVLNELYKLQLINKHVYKIEHKKIISDYKYKRKYESHICKMVCIYFIKLYFILFILYFIISLNL